MLKSKVMGEKLVDKDMRAIYGAIGCNCLPGCDCTASNGANFLAPFEKHMGMRQGSYYSPKDPEQ